MPEPVSADAFARALPAGRGGVNSARVDELTEQVANLSRWQVTHALKRAGKLLAAAGITDAHLDVPEELRERHLRRHVADTLRRFPRAVDGLCAPDCYDAAHDAVGQVIAEHPDLPGRLAAELSPGVPAAGDWAGWSRMVSWMEHLSSFDSAESARILRRDLAKKPLN